MLNADITVKIYQITALVTAIAALLNAIFVYAKNRRLMLNRLWALFCLLTACWSYCYHKWSVLTGNFHAALTWNRWGNHFAILIPAVFLHFTLYLIEQIEEKRKVLYISYGITALILISALLFPGHFIRTLMPKVNFSNYPEGGIIFLLFFTMQFFMIMGYSLYLQFTTFKKLKGLKRNQVKYTWIAMLIGIGGASTNFFPMFHIPVYPFGNIFVGVYVFIIAFAIIRYRLMEIDTVIHKTALWVLTLLLLILPVGMAVVFSFDWVASLSRMVKLALTSSVLIFFVWYYGKLKPRIDHIFRRRKYDYYEVLGEIGQKIGSELDINRVIDRLFKELKEVLYIKNGLILVQQPEQLYYKETGNIGYEMLPQAEGRTEASVKCNDSLSRWFEIYQKTLEKEQVEVDPQYTSIKEEALTFLNQNFLELLIPVIMEDKVNAIIGIGKKENLQPYTIKDVELLQNTGRQIGITIDNALHHEDIIEKERLAEELKLGREIQTALLPQESPCVAGLIVHGLMQPAKEIGGDYYDFISLSAEGQFAVVIGDVSGKGVGAGLLMAMAKTAIHTLSQEQSSPREILLRTNRILNQHIGAQKFMTMLYFLWQSQNRILTYSSAGHEYILIYRSSTQNIEAIQSGGFMLGMMPDIDRFLEEKQLPLQSGDKILLYTDGVTEAEDQKGDRFGLERLKESFKKYSSEAAAELMQSIKDEVYAFIGNHPQYDDITLVVLEAV